MRPRGRRMGFDVVKTRRLLWGGQQSQKCPKIASISSIPAVFQIFPRFFPGLSRYFCFGSMKASFGCDSEGFWPELPHFAPNSLGFTPNSPKSAPNRLNSAQFSPIPPKSLGFFPNSRGFVPIPSFWTKTSPQFPKICPKIFQDFPIFSLEFPKI